MSDAHGPPLRQRTVKEQPRSPRPESQDQSLGSSAEFVSVHGRTTGCVASEPREAALYSGAANAAPAEA